MHPFFFYCGANKMNDQPGRVLAITVIGPAMLWAGHSLSSAASQGNKEKLMQLAAIIGPSLKYFAVFFIVYEIAWVLCADPRTM